MALIPLEGLGAPSQKTSLLGGVAQILIFPRPSPRLADVGLFVRPKSQQSSLRTKSLPASSTIFTLEDQMLHWDPTLHCVRLRHALCEVLQSVTPLHHHCQISREPNISFTGAYCAFLRQWGGQAYCAFASLGDLHRRTSPTHTTKFGAWIWYHLKDLGHHPKRLAFRWSCPNPYILKTIPTPSLCETICSTQISTHLACLKYLAKWQTFGLHQCTQRCDP